MKTNGTVELYYDKDNKPIEYQYIAKGKEDEEEYVGYLVIEKPYYSFEDQWIYWLYTNISYNEDNHLERTEVDPSTLRLYTQTEEIKQYLKHFNVNLKKRMYLFEDEEPEDNLVAFIECQTELPKGLWKGI